MNLITIIQETATWIYKVNADFDINLFRSPEHSPEHYFCEIPDEQKSAVVIRIVCSRAEMLQQAGISLIPVDVLVNYGRVMFFDADDTVLDGARLKTSVHTM